MVAVEVRKESQIDEFVVKVSGSGRSSTKCDLTATLMKAGKYFSVADVPPAELHIMYQTPAVRVLHLRRR